VTRIGAVVITRNEERDLAACLESLAFCDERLVVDSFSTDATARIACEQAERVVQRDFTTHAEQKNWALAQLDTPWILIVDADERVPAALASELRELAEHAEHDGYWIRRRTWFFGRAIRGAGWQRDRVLRFLRREAGEYPPRAVHEEIELYDGRPAGACRHRLEHHSYRDWDRAFARLLSYSSRAAADRVGRGRPTPAKVFFSPLARFGRQYLLQGGFRDGLHGFVLCGFSAIGVFLRWAKLAIGEVDIPGGRGQDGPARVEVLKGPDARDPKPRAGR